MFIDSTTINAGSIISYLYDLGDGSNSIIGNPVNTYLNFGEYPVRLTVESDNGCFSIYDGTAAVQEVPVANFNTTNVCDEEEMIFQNQSFISSGDLQYDWSFGDDFGISVEENPQYIYDNSGTYSVQLTVTAGSLCADSIRANVEVYPLPEPYILAEQDTVSKGYSTQLLAFEGQFFFWEPGISLSDDDVPNPVATPLETTTYTVTSVDSNACSNTANYKIEVLEDFRVVATNAVTPDGNGKNDFWVVNNIENYSSCNVRIYDRWGTEVYAKDAYQNDWSGSTQSGEPLPDGTYYYIITFDDSNRDYKGAVTIFRNAQ